MRRGLLRVEARRRRRHRRRARRLAQPLSVLREGARSRGPARGALRRAGRRHPRRDADREPGDRALRPGGRVGPAPLRPDRRHLPPRRATSPPRRGAPSSAGRSTRSRPDFALDRRAARPAPRGARGGALPVPRRLVQGGALASWPARSCWSSPPGSRSAAPGCASARAASFRPSEAIKQLARYVLPFPLTNAQKRAVREIAEDLALRPGDGPPAPGRRRIRQDRGRRARDADRGQERRAGGSDGADRDPRGAARREPRVLADGRRRPPGAADRAACAAPGASGCSQALAAGEIDVLVGTHALVESPVRFRRAGARRRRRAASLRRRPPRAPLPQGRPSPHVLIMTATPIPRSLAWAIYGELDVSVLDEKPPGRGEVTTRVREEEARERVYAFAGERAAAGRARLRRRPGDRGGGPRGRRDPGDGRAHRRGAARGARRRSPRPHAAGRATGGSRGFRRRDAFRSSFRRRSSRSAWTFRRRRSWSSRTPRPSASPSSTSSAGAWAAATAAPGARSMVGKSATPEARRRLAVLEQTSDGFADRREGPRGAGPGRPPGHAAERAAPAARRGPVPRPRAPPAGARRSPRERAEGKSVGERPVRVSLTAFDLRTLERADTTSDGGAVESSRYGRNRLRGNAPGQPAAPARARGRGPRARSRPRPGIATTGRSRRCRATSSSRRRCPPPWRAGTPSSTWSASSTRRAGRPSTACIGEATENVVAAARDARACAASST